MVVGENLGEYDFGKIYKGQWNNKDVALKQLDLDFVKKSLAKNQSDEILVKTIEMAVYKWATTRHPNIVKCLGVVENGSEVLILSEFCSGGSLSHRLLSSDPDWNTKWRWVLDIAMGLEYLHNNGISYRNISSENILLDNFNRAKLSDKGMMQGNLIPNGKISRLSSPETYVAKSTGSWKNFAEDIYALGFVCWQMTNKCVTPRDVENPAEFPPEEIEKWTTGAPTYSREKIPDDCPENFANLIKLCWTFAPDQRPTASALLNLIKKSLTEIFTKKDEISQMLFAVNTLNSILEPMRRELSNYVQSSGTTTLVEDTGLYWDKFEVKKTHFRCGSPVCSSCC